MVLDFAIIALLQGIRSLIHTKSELSGYKKRVLSRHTLYLNKIDMVVN